MMTNATNKIIEIIRPLATGGFPLYWLNNELKSDIDFAGFKKCYLLSTGNKGYSLPCDECPSNCPREIRDFSDGTVEALCRKDFAEPIILSAKNRIIWQLNKDAFHEKICELLNISHVKPDTPECLHTWRIGEQISSGSYIPVYISYPTDKGKLKITVEHLISANANNSFMLITPHRRFVQGDVDSRLKHKGVTYQAMEHFLEYLDNDFVLSGMAVNPETHSPVNNIQANNIFRRGAGQWEVRFKGGKIFPVPDLLGASYLNQLLSKPGEVQTAFNVICGATIDTSSRFISLHEAIESGFNITKNETPSGFQEALDWQAIKEYRSEILKLKEQESGLIEENNTTELVQVQNDIERIEQELKRSLGLGGKAKNLDKKPKNYADKLRNSIKRVIGAIKERNEPLAEHLEQNIGYGNNPIYRSTEIKWETEPNKIKI
jgi:hypothetical protein